jgi:hypothetical protein
MVEKFYVKVTPETVTKLLKELEDNTSIGWPNGDPPTKTKKQGDVMELAVGARDSHVCLTLEDEPWHGKNGYRQTPTHAAFLTKVKELCPKMEKK